MKRIATAAVGLPILFVIIKYLNPAVFFVLVGAAAALAVHEWNQLAGRRGIRGDRILGTLFTLAVVYSFADDRLDLAAVLATAVIVVPGRFLLSRAGVEGAFEAVASSLGAILFIGVPLGYVVELMGIGDEMGRDLTVLLFLIVWISDAGAYAVGSWIGKHPLSPSVSPKKSIEGAAGGLVMSLVAALLAKAWFFQRLHLHDAVLLAVLLWVAGMAGDLSESLLKRAASVKDTGVLFPGHGGMLDRADSLLFAAPVLFFYYRAFMV